MRWIPPKLQAIVGTLLLASLSVIGMSANTKAESANAPSLVISQLKITSGNGQFVTLYNMTNSELDMSKYQLEYFNNYDLTKASSSRVVALAGTVPPHGYYMVNDSSMTLCYKLTINSTSLGFSSTAGFLELLSYNQAAVGGSISTTLQDYVGWSKTAVAGAQTLPTNPNAFLQRKPTDTVFNPAITTPGGGAWQAVQPDSNNQCNFITVATSPTATQTGMSLLLASSAPPASIVSVSESGIEQPASGVFPAADIGLQIPAISELLPNPSGTGTDNTEEFIELYNPNDVNFDLSGFSLQVGSNTLHSYAFPSGTMLAPHGFSAFYSADTGLALSNTSGQARLLDPFGNSIYKTGTYSSAKDGQSWSLAGDKWFWTSVPTPNRANTIVQPIKRSSKKGAGLSKSPKKNTATKTAKVLAAKSNNSSVTNATTDQPRASIQFATLAIIGGLALLYGAYEYRTDIANTLSKLRRHVKIRRTNRT